MPFFVVEKPTPVLNQFDFSAVFTVPLPLDDQNLVRALEMIAFPGTVFEVLQELQGHVLEVRTLEYPTCYPLFVDSRFGKIEEERPCERKKALPTADVILKRLESQLGLPYIWGGNVGVGVPDLLRYYPPQKKLTRFESDTWTFKGVDCSGLLYEATGGSVPRNTRDLLLIGRSVSICNLSWQEIAKILKPLDLIIWRGHMVIVFDQEKMIESKHEWGGVCLTDISKRLKLLCEADQKIPTEDPIHVLENPSTFLVRRFIS